MAIIIESIRPNLFLAEGVYKNVGEVYFSLGDEKDFKEASILVDSIVAENVGQLKVGRSSNILPSNVSLWYVFFHNRVEEEYGNFGLPLMKFLEGVVLPHREPEKSPSGKGESGNTRQSWKPVLWDSALDPREMVYAATADPQYSSYARILNDFDNQIAELETANGGWFVYDRNATRKAIEIKLKEAGKKIDSPDAVYHVVKGGFPGEKSKDYPVGRVSIFHSGTFPDGTSNDERVRRVMKALAGSMERFDGPKLSIDNVPKYMHALKTAETYVESISREFGDCVRVTSGRISRQKLLIQE